MPRTAIVALAGLALAIASAATAQAPRSERVQFARGTSSKTIVGQIRGDATVEYVVGAKAGQTLNVTLKSSNGANYFNIWAPGATPGSDAALATSDLSDNRVSRRLPASGDYRVQVYLMRSAARRNELANYTLTIGVTGAAATAALGADAKVAGTQYNATAEVGCAIGAGAPLGRCKAGVMRFAGGEATVEITLPSGGKRHIYFAGGRATSSDAMSGAFEATKDGDLNRIAIGATERYEFPDAFVVGG
ncbi:MAG: hypothetical protein JNK30_07330 [Phenylobacterium sp.]|uniref:hypothetical protein n=1 Tax=Phenylobacterium sp. TaxID=1871053 RepID=UPI001A5B79B7|nr:hypothetical protein [Phenylobacterium sp.]MBL8771179.1 hypothetical protein [Phenylobacterium sp.]